MAATASHRLLSSTLTTISISSLSFRSLSTIIAISSPTTSLLDHPQDPPSPPNPIRTRTRTPFDKEFESWTRTLRPGFTTDDVNQALRSQSDPDLALDIFRWTAHQRGYRHDHSTYLTIIQISVAAKRIHHAETLLEEVLAGACPMSTPLYNSMLRFCCSRRFLFKRAFDVYKRMYASADCKPDVETYTMLFEVLLRRFGTRLNVNFVYLRSVRSLTKQMKATGVIPDTFVLNMIIKAFSKCLEVDEAVKVFKEMGLYGCQPNSYTYSYLIKGFCEKERVGTGMRLFTEMREKGLVPGSSAFMVLVCSLALERRFEEAADVVFDMLDNFMSPDQLAYKTLLDEMCRDGKGNDALELLEEFRKRDAGLEERTYQSLLDALYFPNHELN